MYPLIRQMKTTARVRHAFGLSIVVAGAVILLAHAWQAIAVVPAMRAALASGSIAALATALGVLPMLLARAPGRRIHDAMLGFGAGVMLAATCFSLIVPALGAAQSQGHGAWSAALITGGGLLLGAGCLMLLERQLPHEHFFGGAGAESSLRIRRLWLFIFAIVLHNIPEGLAIGVSAAGTDPARSAALATGIAIQDVPEGLVVALALQSAGIRRWPAALLGAASGLVEPIAAVLGAAALSYSAPLLPWGLAFAAGAMLFVVSHEVIPESHRQGHERYATTGLLLGFVLMMVLDTALV
ncbi:ZIP family metal transporter [Uliginosibacterium sp. H1]|uniref:ZIP family metal transporter n=1 Tax=Uliginosibacterium sp. H1 TaxID=3114757 RepID=UPI002E173E42|nr:ZIP family metal transporter [Uliginosibacterium sp. H1]